MKKNPKKKPMSKKSILFLVLVAAFVVALTYDATVNHAFSKEEPESGFLLYAKELPMSYEECYDRIEAEDWPQAKKDFYHTINNYAKLVLFPLKKLPDILPEITDGDKNAGLAEIIMKDTVKDEYTHIVHFVDMDYNLVVPFDKDGNILDSKENAVDYGIHYRPALVYIECTQSEFLKNLLVGTLTDTRTYDDTDDNIVYVTDLHEYGISYGTDENGKYLSSILVDNKYLFEFDSPETGKNIGTDLYCTYGEDEISFTKTSAVVHGKVISVDGVETCVDCGDEVADCEFDENGEMVCCGTDTAPDYFDDYEDETEEELEVIEEVKE